MADIHLTALNARYMHTAFGLRYLYANLGELQPRACIDEFTIHQRPADIVEKLLQQGPRIIGLGVYIWNVEEVGQTVALLKQVSPETIVVLGGPEVSHYPDHPEVAALADYVIEGEGETSFRELCEQLLAGKAPPGKIIKGKSVPLDELELPYAYYTDEDI
ncbi:MAG: cobalamin-dependent protein, partial [Gammaproteobacteria bacterium]|nr:cobalamin-dependent protein [Gammaproteobacteria bacterium]